MMFPYGYLIAAIAVLLAIGASGYKGYSLGQDNIRTEWQAAALKEATENQAKYIEINERNRAREAQDAKKLQTVSKGYQAKLKEKENENVAALAVARATGLFDHGQPAKCETAGSPAAPVADGGRVDHGPTGTRFSEAATTFLLAEALRADQYTEQLNACIQVIRADRE